MPGFGKCEWEAGTWVALLIQLMSPQAENSVQIRDWSSHAVIMRISFLLRVDTLGSSAMTFQHLYALCDDQRTVCMLEMCCVWSRSWSSLFSSCTAHFCCTSGKRCMLGLYAFPLYTGGGPGMRLDIMAALCWGLNLKGSANTRSSKEIGMLPFSCSTREGCMGVVSSCL